MNLDQVKVFRLINGEFIIGEILNADRLENATKLYSNDKDGMNSIFGSNSLMIKNPVKIVIIPSGNPNIGAKETHSVGFTQWVMFSSDECVELNISSILAVAIPDKDFLDNYKASFSNVILPKSSGLILPQGKDVR